MTGAEAHFEELFRDNYPDLLRYALRRCPARSEAEDVVAETFAVAWRRIDEIPSGPRARLWLYGTARLVRMNSHRAHRRRQGLHERLRTRWLPGGWNGADAELAERDRVERALATLGALDREVIQLHVWEQLTAAEIAASLELTPSATRKRLQRARAKLATAFDEGTRSTSDDHAFAASSQEVAR